MTFGALGELYDGPHATPTRRDEGPYFLNIASLKSGRLDLEASDHVSREDFAKWTRRVTPRDGDLLFSYETRLGEAALMPAELEACLGRRMALLRPNCDVIDSRFLLYLYLSPAFQRTITTHTVHGATVPRIGLASMPQWPVSIPTIDEQRVVGEVLGALDDKIAANGAIRQLVDRLLMAEFERLAVGRGQAVLADIAIINNAAVKPRPGGVLRYIDIASVAPGDYEFPAESLWDNAPGRARRSVRRGDTIWSTVRPNRRSHALVLDDDPRLVASTGLAVLTPRNGCIAGLYEATRTEQFVRYLESVAEGSAYPAVRAERFGMTPIPALTADEWGQFESFAFPLRNRAHAASLETRALGALRDALLPLLMSGKVRVREAEKVVEGVV